MDHINILFFFSSFYLSCKKSVSASEGISIVKRSYILKVLINQLFVGKSFDGSID